MFRVGQGIDYHKLEKDSKGFMLGGLFIPSDFSVVAHSDGDVLIHAICDAILGALSLHDIGHHFPDTDEKYKNIKSIFLLEKVNDIIKKKEYEVVNIDSTVVLQKPKLKPFISQMKTNLANILSIDASCVSVKATTKENLDAIGSSQGICAHAIVLLQKK